MTSREGQPGRTISTSRWITLGFHEPRQAQASESPPEPRPLIALHHCLGLISPVDCQDYRHNNGRLVCVGGLPGCIRMRQNETTFCPISANPESSQSDRQNRASQITRENSKSCLPSRRMKTRQLCAIRPAGRSCIHDARGYTVQLPLDGYRSGV